MTSNQHGPYALGYKRATMGYTTGSQLVRGSQSYQSTSKFELRSATRPHEVGIASNRESAMSR